jgi:LCP family protein required for cell wall assembly
MPTDAKPYRRYRARGGRGEGDGLAELQQLQDRTSAAAAPPAPAPPRIRRTAPPRVPPGGPRPPEGAPVRRRGFLRGISKGGWAWRLALVALLVIVGWAGFGFWALSGAVGEANDRITPSARRALDPAPGGLLGTPTNTLVIGSDARIGRSRRGLADTIMIMRTDPDSGRVKYLSIPRDYMIQMPGHGTEKINAALSIGGQAGIIREVRNLTGLDIHHIIVISFRGLPKLVDELGGVTVDNPTPLVDCPYPGGRTVSFPRGKLMLDGARALEYARVRKCDNDFARAARQQALVSALKGKVVSPGSFYRAPWRGAAVVRAISTDLGTVDMVKLGWLQARLDQRASDRIVLVGEPTMIGNISYVVGDPDTNEKLIERFESRN